jgi:hypothetical protein
VTRWISPFLAQPHRYGHTNRQITQKCHPSRLTHLSKPYFVPSHIFFIKLGGQGMVITNKGSYPTMFSASKTVQFYKTGHWVVFIKTRTETCIKGRDWICHRQVLAEGPDRSTVPRVRGRRTGPRSLGHSRESGPSSFTPCPMTQTSRHTIKRKN